MLSPEYIVGLTDGEGSFTVYIKNPDNRTKRKRRVRAEPKFCVKLIEKDRSALVQLRKFFRCGNIYLQKDRRPRHQDCYRYEVTKREDIEKVVIPFFKEHRLHLPSKQKDFKIFCKLMNKIKKGEHLTQIGLKKLYSIKQKMH